MTHSTERGNEWGKDITLSDQVPFADDRNERKSEEQGTGLGRVLSEG